MNLRFLLGLVLLLVAVVDPSVILDKVSNIIPEPAPVIEIEKPADIYIESTKNVAELIKDDEDKVSMAVYCLEFSKRLTSENYTDIKLQFLPDILSEAGKLYFEGSMKGKYDGLSDGLIKIITDEVGEDDIFLEKEQLTELSNKFKALSWNLIN